MNEKWFLAAKKADFQGIARRFGIDQVTARIIRNRDVVTEEEIDRYLNGGLRALNSPYDLLGCPEAAELLREKIQQGKKIRIIGDYDIDGVNATYILYRGLKTCGADVDYEIPDRMKDGYGLNVALLQLALEEGVDTVITCDNGISAIEEIAYAKAQGMTVIVTDHHEPLFVAEEEEEANGEAEEHARCVPVPEEGRIYRLPRADILVNPKQPGCPYPYKKLCGAAVAWKVITVLYELCGLPAGAAEEFLAFAGFATVGDVMDLDGENRIIVKEGLKRLRKTDNPGMRALIQANNLDFDSLSSYHIGFVLGPCINASGRLDTAKRSLRLLLAEDPKEAVELAGQLKELNDERKLLTQQAVDEACAMIEANQGSGSGCRRSGGETTRGLGTGGERPGEAGADENGDVKAVSRQEPGGGGPSPGDRVLVVYLRDCHESIAGIVAGRLRERYGKPAFVVTDGETSAKGSGRSIEAYSMFEEMVKCQDVFLKFGGHPMAAGFSLEKERIGEMRRRLNENCTLTREDMAERVMIDVPMPIDYLTEPLIRELSLLEPFGKGNEKPLFAERRLKLLSARIIGKNKNVVKLQVMNQAGCVMEALYFSDPQVFQDYLTEKYGDQEVKKLFWGKVNNIELDVTYYPSVNEYMGRKTLQIVIKNFR